MYVPVPLLREACLSNGGAPVGTFLLHMVSTTVSHSLEKMFADETRFRVAGLMMCKVVEALTDQDFDNFRYAYAAG